MTRRGEEVASVGADLVTAGASAIPLVGGPVAGLFQAQSNRRLRGKLREHERRLEVLGQIVADLGHRLELLQQATEDPARMDLLEDAAAFAARSRSAAARRLIARVTALAMLPTADASQIGRAHLLMEAVAQLQPEHLDVLEEIGTRRVLSGKAVGTASIGERRSIRGMVHFRPELADVIDPIVARLEGLGLIRMLPSEPSLPTPSRPTPRRSDPEWSLTRFGVEVVKYMERPSNLPA